VFKVVVADACPRAHCTVTTSQPEAMSPEVMSPGAKKCRRLCNRRVVTFTG
jgi:hypothetical protein